MKSTIKITDQQGTTGYTPNEGDKGLVNIEEVAHGVANKAQDRPAQIQSLTERVKEAKFAFEEACKGMGTYYEQFKPQAEKMITDARQCRMTMTAELSNIKREVKDVQAFVESTQYTVSIERMKELLDIAERFVKLSKEQALPVLLDAALKLQVKP